MIDRHHGLPLSRQAKVLGISWGSVYYLPRAVPAAGLALMRRMRCFWNIPSPAAGCCRGLSMPSVMPPGASTSQR